MKLAPTIRRQTNSLSVNSRIAVHFLTSHLELAAIFWRGVCVTFLHMNISLNWQWTVMCSPHPGCGRHRVGLQEKTREMPGRLLHTSSWSRQPSTTTLSQSTSSYSVALPAEHVRAPSGLFGRRSYFVEHFTKSSPWSNTEFWQFSRKLLRTRNYLRVIKHTKCSRDASWFCAMYEFTIDIDIDIGGQMFHPAIDLSLLPCFQRGWHSTNSFRLPLDFGVEKRRGREGNGNEA